MTHRYHPDPAMGDHPDAIVFDGCEECEARAKLGIQGIVYFDDEVFDQTSAPASPGSSGGGIFSREGEHLGMVTLGAGETFVLFVPARRIAAWLEAKGYGFLCPGWAAQPVAAEAQVPLTPPEASPVAEGAPDDH